jgi:hypothetical protein
VVLVALSNGLDYGFEELKGRYANPYRSGRTYRIGPTVPGVNDIANVSFYVQRQESVLRCVSVLECESANTVMEGLKIRGKCGG